MHEKDIGTFYDYESANYSILSAKQIGTSEIVCPNCGNATTRENLIDGCDYCGTKFTVEDLEDRVNDFRIMVELSKKGLSDEGRRLELESDRAATAMVRRFDPNFSLRSFRANLFNKVAAIHFADSMQQISAFSDDDLSHFMDQYKKIAYIDFRRLIFMDDSFLIEHGLKEKNNYYVGDGMQKITCVVSLGLFELLDGKIQLRMEQVKLELEKLAECKTQNICGPSVFKCNSCGSSLSLMDGKACPYCGRELDLRKYDWVITKYTSKLDEYGKSWRTLD